MKIQYLLPLLLIVAPVVAGDVYYDNVVVVVDASGSMGDTMSGSKDNKMSVAKDALKTVLSQVDDNTQIGVIVFGSVRHEWIYPVSKKDQNKLNDAIDSIRAGGGTPLGEYIKKGADALLKQRNKQMGYGSYRLLVVTDGEASDANKMRRYVPDVKSRGIVLDVIGVDMQDDHQLAEIANSYRKGNNPAELQEAMKEVFAEVSSDSGSLDEAFELISPIPSDLAQVIVKSLGTSGNHPIGDQPKPKPQKVVNDDGSVSYVMTGADSGGGAIGATGVAIGGVVMLIVLGIVIMSRS